MVRSLLLRPTLRTPVFQPFWSRLHRLSLWGMNIGPAGSLEEGGEDWVLHWCARQSSPDQPFVLIDGGANVGEYAARALQLIRRRLQVHCFEPAPRAFSKLANRLSAEPQVRLFPFGLSDATAECDLYSHEGGDREASLTRRDLSHWNLEQDRVERVLLRRLDDVCRDEGITRVDLLKLDVEGHELPALRGASALLESRSIRHIQFEFGSPDIESRTYFKDLFKLLNPNYRIYRIVHSGLASIEGYSEFHENFATTNFLAVAR